MESLRIGYDAKRAFHNGTGLGNYSRSLIAAMVSLYPHNRYYLFNTKSAHRYFRAPEGAQEIRPKNLLNRKLPSLWRSFALNGLAHDLDLDIYHGLSHELPLGKKNGRTKWVLTVHDLIFMRFPQYFSRIDRQLYAYKIKKACEKADCIIAISEQTKSDLVQYLQQPADKVKVLYQDCNPIFKQQVSEQGMAEVRERYALPERFVLQVGTIETRKNLLLSIRAMAHLPREVHLVAVGKKTDYLDEVQATVAHLGLKGRVHFIHDADFGDFPAIYRAAEIFLYPSRFEGFGIPIIEALHCGIPVIAATGSCLEEAGGPSSIYVHPDDVDAMAKNILYLLGDPQRRVQIGEKGRIFAQRFDSKLLAWQLLDIYHNLLRDEQRH